MTLTCLQSVHVLNRLLHCFLVLVHNIYLHPFIGHCYFRSITYLTFSGKPVMDALVSFTSVPVKKKFCDEKDKHGIYWF